MMDGKDDPEVARTVNLLESYTQALDQSSSKVAKNNLLTPPVMEGDYSGAKDVQEGKSELSANFYSNRYDSIS